MSDPGYEEALFDDVYTEISLARGTDDSYDEEVDYKRQKTERIIAMVAEAVAAPLRAELDLMRRMRDANKEALRYALETAFEFKAENERLVEDRDEYDELLHVAEARLSRLRDLFNGGPDTPCRTRWEDGVECVSIPLADLSEALAESLDGSDDTETRSA